MDVSKRAMFMGGAFALAAVLIAGCSVSSHYDSLKERGAERAGGLAADYCERYTGPEQAVFQTRVDEATDPHRLRVECAEE